MHMALCAFCLWDRLLVLVAEIGQVYSGFITVWVGSKISNPNKKEKRELGGGGVKQWCLEALFHELTLVVVSACPGKKK